MKFTCLSKYKAFLSSLLLFIQGLIWILNMPYGRIFTLFVRFIMVFAFGDFNDIMKKEKFGGNRVNFMCMHDFNNVIQNYNLLDLGFTGQKFTWSNCRKNNLILERLDHFLANPLWLAKFPQTLVTHLSRTHSDHCPLILSTNPNSRHASKPFRLKSIWSNHPFFDTLVHNH